MKRKITALVLAAVLVCALAVPVSAELNVDVRNSIVAVSSHLDTEVGLIGFGSGTGFFINDQYLITNYHVVESFLKNGAGEQVVGSLNGTQIIGHAVVQVYFDSDDCEEAYIVGYDEHKDIAILRLDKSTQKRVPLKLKVPTEDMVGKTIYAVGFPGLSDNSTASATEKWGKNDATVTSGTISRLLTQSGTGRQNVQIDCDIKHGNSGGPVVISDGSVIGVATWGTSTADITTNENNQIVGIEIEEVKYAVNISEAIQMLNQYGISYTTATDVVESAETEAVTAGETKEETNLPVILGAVAAGLIIAGLVVAIVVMKKGAAGRKPAAAAAPVCGANPR